MLNTLGPKLYIKLALFLSRWKKTPQLSIADQLYKANRIMICFPDNQDAVNQIQKTAYRFNEIFPNKTLTVLCPETISCDQLPSTMKVVKIKAQNFTSFGTPSPSMIETLFNPSPEIFIDLNETYHPKSTLLALKSQATLKIGFSHEYRDPLYNFVIRPALGGEWEQSLRSLFQYLSITPKINNHETSLRDA